ncbi:MAG: methionyl-tRNA formyltransferase, partial [Acidobacteriota bacterium]
KPAGRGNKLHQSPVKEFAVQHNLTVHQPLKIKTEEAQRLFASHNADAAVVVAYGRILPAGFLNTPPNGCINVHFSLLPKYRGAAPVNWAIVNGERETGVTTMKIVEQLDAGPILLQRATEITERETAPELMTRLAEIGAELLSETLEQLDTIQPQAQSEAEATFAPMLKRENGLIDWTMDAYQIDRSVRGFQPWPNAFTELNSRRLIVWQATPEWIEHLRFSSGQVIEARGERLVIACGEGTALRVSELQMEGGRRLSARDFLNGAHLKAGKVLGI